MISECLSESALFRDVSMKDSEDEFYRQAASNESDTL